MIPMILEISNDAFNFVLKCANLQELIQKWTYKQLYFEKKKQITLQSSKTSCIKDEISSSEPCLEALKLLVLKRFKLSFFIGIANNH